MNEDTLLKELAERARQAHSDDLDARWDALAAGQLSAEERQALIDATPDGERLAAAFDPLSRQDRDAIRHAARAALGAASTGTEAPEKRPTKWILALAAGVVATIAVTNLLPRSPDFAPLPAYSSSFSGGAVMRSEPDAGETPVLRDGDRIELILRPATSVAGTLATRAFLLSGETMTPISLPAAEWSGSGAARIIARVGDDVALPAGDSTLLVVVGRPDTLPDVRALERADAAVEAQTDWRVLRFALRVTPP